MANTKTTIELNGKRYDALTGTMLNQNSVQTTPGLSKAQSVRPGRNMDGFMRAPANSLNSKSRTSVPRPVKAVAHHKPQKAQTLMRTVVKKPVAQNMQTISAKATATERSAVVHVASHAEVIPPSRIGRAQQVAKSAFVTKFTPATKTLVKRTAPLVVQAVPQTEPSIKAFAKAFEPAKDSDIFAEALLNANAHEQEKRQKPTLKHRIAKKLGVSTRAVSMGAVISAAIVLSGFIVYQNVPNLSMRVANARAGFHATLPGYHPGGFALTGPIQYNPGQVTITFKSSSDDRKFSVVQKPSAWNSESLLENYVATNDKTYQTYQNQGRVIYIYNDNNATWVNGGIWYDIQSGASLSSEQLLKIANSL